MLEAIRIHHMISFKDFLRAPVISETVVRQGDLQESGGGGGGGGQTHLTSNNLGIGEDLFESRQDGEGNGSLLLLQEHVDSEQGDHAVFQRENGSL
jgi:hypothetical protein